MKILLAYEWCLIGGVEAFMVALAKYLRAQGHQCEFFFFTRGPMEKQLPEDFAAHFGDLADCMKLVQSRGFDIVHANSSDWRVGISAVRTVGAKLVITAHGMVVASWNSTNCDAFSCVSKWQSEEQKHYTDLPIHTVMNGINTEMFVPNAQVTEKGPPIVAWVGRGIDMKHKRIDKLASIAPALQRAGVRLWIADPWGFEEVEKIVPDAARTLKPIAEFWGAVSRERMPQFFQEVAASGGCILSTSISEGFGLALVEAQGCGCPAIGTDVRGVNEGVRPEHGGELFPFEMEADELAKLVIDTLNDKEKMEWRRESCVKFVREYFNLERMADDYIRIYHEALNRRSKYLTQTRLQHWLAPLLHWGEYTERRWSAGQCHYEASRKLAEQSEWALATSAAWLSLSTCPTLYLRPERLTHLLKILKRPNNRLNKRPATK